MREHAGAPPDPGASRARRHFPSLAGAPCARLDLDAEFRRWSAQQPGLLAGGGPSPFLDPAVAAGMLSEVHAAAGVAWSFGGYLEDRRHLLSGSYLDATSSWLHLGVDFNVPEGTPVAAGAPGRVVLVDDDGDRDGGWGRRVFLRRTGGDVDRVAVFAHLHAVSCRPGDLLAEDRPFAEVGGPPDNGNWYPHLHVQLMATADFETMLGERFRELDGYGRPEDLPELATRFPDPLTAW